MSDTVNADYFDGRSARPRRVQAQVSNGQLVLSAPDWRHRLDLQGAQWPERTQRGVRIAHFADGSSLQAVDVNQWDAWAQACVPAAQTSWVVRAQLSWRATAAALLALLLAVGLMYWQGLPLAARAILAVLPISIDQRVGDTALAQVGTRWLQASKLKSDERERIRNAFDAAVRAAYPRGDAPPYQLLFHSSKIGPNAFALPGGNMILTDELVDLSRKAGDDGTGLVVGVLAHELGHIQHRHGMRLLVQVGVLGTVSSVAFGDFSSVLALVPVLLGQAGYSREAEREADAESIRILQAADYSPEVMVKFFELVRQAKPQHDDTGLGIAFSSHPADAERVARFRAAALGR